MEPTQQDSLPFLDTLVTIQPDDTFSTTVYRKPTHIDQYLHWDSNHHITAKQSVFNTLAHMAKTVSSSQVSFNQEMDHIKTALQHCQFHSWALNQWQLKFTQSNQQSNNNTNTTNCNNPVDNTKNKATIVVPYIPNTSEKFKKLCERKGIQVHFKGTKTPRTALGNPKDKDPKANQTGIIYHYQCPHINCPSAYIGESGRTLGDRVKEHFKASSPIHLHSTTTGHPMDPNQFNIVHKEFNSHSRTIKGAMFIYIQDPLEQKPWKVPASAHMGPPPPDISNPSAQAKQSTTQLYSHVTPPTGPPPPSATTTVGGMHNFFLYFMVSTHMYPKFPPLLIYNKSYTSAILVSFLHFIC